MYHYGGLGPLICMSGPPLIVATMLRPQGNTGVQTHVRQLLKYLAASATATTLVTPFNWARPAYVPVYGLRRAIDPVSGPASVFWYRRWHEMFLRGGLRNVLSSIGDCVIYAQDPPSARAALAARRNRGQQVVLAVHFVGSQADEWVEKGKIPRDSWVFRNIRQLEHSVIPRVDRIVYVSGWAEKSLKGWLPEAAQVPSSIIGNFAAPWPSASDVERYGDLVTVGYLDPGKNHRFLLRMLAETKNAGRLLTLDIFGDGPLRKELELLANELDIAEQVRFRGYRSDVRDFLPGYRAYVHASYTESSSLAIIEAMDARLPIVAADIGPIAELFDDGVEGRFWTLDSPGQAAAVLLEMLDDEPVRLKSARAARERFDRDFDANAVGPRLRHFLLGS